MFLELTRVTVGTVNIIKMLIMEKKNCKQMIISISSMLGTNELSIKWRLI